MSKRNVIIIIAVVLVCAALGGYFYMDHQNKIRLALEKKIRQETLIIAFDEMPQTLNPLFEQNSAGMALLDPLFDGLANRSGEYVRHYQDALASDFIQDEENRNEYTIELDDERRWHDDPNHIVSAEDIRFTVECIKNEKNRSPLRGRVNQLIERVEIIDDATLKIMFKENISVHVIRDLLSFKIIPKTYFGKSMGTDLRTDPVAQEFNRKPIGTGAFRFKGWQGNKISFSLNQVSVPPAEDDEETVEGTPQSEMTLQTIESILIHDQEKQVRMLMDGKVDLILEAPTKLHGMMNEKGLKQADYIPLHFYAIAFNTDSPVFKDQRARQAVSKAINKKALAATIRSDDVSQYLNVGPFPHNDDKRYRKFEDMLPYSMRSAKKLLRNKSMTTTLIYKDDPSKTMERLASKIALMLKRIGVTVEKKGLGMAFDTQLTNRNFEMALVRHSGFTDGYNIAHLYRSNSPENITGVNSGQLDAVLDRWENSAFWEQRLPAARKLHQILSILSPYTYLFSLPTSAYYSPRLTGVTIIDPNALLGTVSDWKAIPD